MARYRGPRDKTATFTQFVMQHLERNQQQWLSAHEIAPHVLHVAERFHIQPNKMVASVVAVMHHLATKGKVAKKVFTAEPVTHYRRPTLYIYPTEAQHDVPIPPDVRGAPTDRDAPVQRLPARDTERSPVEV